MVSMEFLIHIILTAALWPWGVKVADALGWQSYHLHVSTQPITEMSTSNISWKGGGGKGGRCVGLKTLPTSGADCLEIWEPQPPGTLWACNGTALPWYILYARATAIRLPSGVCGKRFFVFSKASKWDLGFTQPPTWRVPGFSVGENSRDVKLLACP
jgi:hypothetical protein